MQSSTLETDLKIEREWRQSLQETLVKDREAKAELQQQVKELTKQQEVSVATSCMVAFAHFLIKNVFIFCYYIHIQSHHLP